MWTNLTPLEIIQNAYQLILGSPTCLVDDILDLGHHLCVVHDDYQPPFIVVNRIVLP